MGRSRRTFHGKTNLEPRKQIERRRIIDRCGLNCHWCNVCTDNSIYNEGSPRATTIDHVYNKLDPMRKGNDDKAVVACFACNQMRARMHELVFLSHHTIDGELQMRPSKKDTRAEQVVVEKIEPTAPKPIEVEVEREEIKQTTFTSSIAVIQGPKIVVDVPVVEAEKPKEIKKPLPRWQKVLNWIKNVLTWKGASDETKT